MKTFVRNTGHARAFKLLALEHLPLLKTRVVAKNTEQHALQDSEAYLCALGIRYAESIFSEAIREVPFGSRGYREEADSKKLDSERVGLGWLRGIPT